MSPASRTHHCAQRHTGAERPLKQRYVAQPTRPRPYVPAGRSFVLRCAAAHALPRHMDAGRPCIPRYVAQPTRPRPHVPAERSFILRCVAQRSEHGGGL